MDMFVFISRVTSNFPRYIQEFLATVRTEKCWKWWLKASPPYAASSQSTLCTHAHLTYLLIYIALSCQLKGRFVRTVAVTLSVKLYRYDRTSHEGKKLTRPLAFVGLQVRERHREYVHYE